VGLLYDDITNYPVRWLECEAVACLSSQVKCNFYQLLYCALYLWRINLILFEIQSTGWIDVSVMFLLSEIIFVVGSNSTLGPTFDDEFDDVRDLSDDIGECARVRSTISALQPT